LEDNSSNGTNGVAFGPTTGINKGEGPGGGEFFFDDRYRPSNASADGSQSSCGDANDQDPILDPQLEQGHDEIFVGGIFHYYGQITVYGAAYDPINNFNNFNNAGVVSLSTSDGSRQGGNQIYATPSNPGTFAKGNGLGDVEGVSGAAPIQVGNRLWLDANSNGRQDPNEDGINGVLVELFKETAPATFTKVAETTTMADAVQGNGFFVFSNDSDVNQTWVSGIEVLAEMNYEIRVSLAAVQAQDGTVQAFAAANTGGVTDNNNKTDLNDSDADASGVIAFTTGIEGQNNHTLDIGAVSMPPCILTINSSTPDMTCTGGTYDVDFALTWTDAPSMLTSKSPIVG
ncbi:MAG: SdrD B-like domain-containing protein, partial [Bacteroidota bacterium]